MYLHIIVRQGNYQLLSGSVERHQDMLHDFRFDVQPTLQMSINIPLSFLTTEFLIGPFTRIQPASYIIQRTIALNILLCDVAIDWLLFRTTQ